MGMENPDGKRTLLIYDFPLAEVITDYYDRLKSVSRGYASMDYKFAGYKHGDLVKVDILVNKALVAKGEVVVINENFGVRITEIIGTAARIQYLGGKQSKKEEG